MYHYYQVSSTENP